MLAPILIVTVFAICFLAFTDGNFIDDLFNPGIGKSPQFSNSQLYLLDGSNSVGLDDLNGTIGCFGDFNSDKYTDVFAIEGTDLDTRVNVYLWDRHGWQFQNSSASVVLPYITNIAAGDFNYDGKLDLMVTAWNNNTNSSFVRIYLGNLSTLRPSPAAEINDVVAQVAVMDINNDLWLDLFGEVYLWNEVTNTSYTKRVFWVNNKDRSDTTVTFSFLNDPFGTYPLYPLRSSAFVDINGDCLADRFVVSQNSAGKPQYELLLNGKSQGYNFSPNTSAVPLPPGAGQVSFSDFDKDGNIDFIVPVCYPAPNCTEVNAIYVYLNKQKSLCTLLSKSRSCRPSTDLCTADSKFHIGVFNASPPDPYFQMVPITPGDHFYFDESIDRPLAIRVGDFNLDGYPDILVPIVGSTGIPRVELWHNSGNGQFAKVTVGTDALMDIPYAYAATFFDLDEDGILDIFVLADNPPRIVTLFNNFEYDAFFLKALGLNGVCTEWCPTQPKFPSPKPYGVNYAGAVFKFMYTDLNGRSQLATGTQLPQSTYMALETPYVLFGLGRTSNYIEQFFFGVPLNTSHFNYWTGSTIPNSQVVAVPYKPDNPAGWTLELYITPSGLLFWIMIALVASLITLAIIVFIFYRKEKKEDEQKKQEQAHLFSFDAL